MGGGQGCRAGGGHSCNETKKKNFFFSKCVLLLQQDLGTTLPVDAAGHLMKEAVINLLMPVLDCIHQFQVWEEE